MAKHNSFVCLSARPIQSEELIDISLASTGGPLRPERQAPYKSIYNCVHLWRIWNHQTTLASRLAGTEEQEELLAPSSMACR